MISDTACLHLPDLNQSYVVQTDASSHGLGAVPFQAFGGGLCPTVYISHMMTPAGRNYSVTNQECLAIFCALKKFDMYLDEATFTIQTDHQAIAWFKNLKNPDERLALRALSLAWYSYWIE